MTLKKHNPTEPSILDSAWAAIRQEINPPSIAEVREQGWKTIKELAAEFDIPVRTARERLMRMVEQGKLETQVLMVNLEGTSHVRSINLFRPFISPLKNK